VLGGESTSRSNDDVTRNNEFDLRVGAAKGQSTGHTQRPDASCDSRGYEEMSRSRGNYCLESILCGEFSKVNHNGYGKV
jgi:hypothetical protein